MAEGTHDLYLRLGLNYDELESGFVEAESTIRHNMTRLSNENTVIKLRAEAEIAGLDEVADAAEIFTIRQQALNQQIANQRDRVNMAQATLQDMANRYGATSQQAQRATMSFERQRITLARLEQQLRELNETQNESQNNNGGGGFSENLQNIFGNFPAVGGKILAVAAAFKTVEEAISAVASKSVELIEKFREIQKQSYDLNMSFDESKKFLRQMRLGGGDYGDFEGYIRGITDAFVKGEYDDPEAIALNKFGAKLTDETGRLKNFKDLTEEVYQAWKKADAAGEGIEFLQLTGGEAGIRDAIQFFKRYEEAKEDASKIFDSGIDPDELHKAERALNLLTEQSDEFKDALTNMITPAAIVAMQELFELFHSGTELVVESTGKIRQWGTIFGEALSTAKNFFSGSETNSDFGGIFDRANAKLLFYNTLQEKAKKNQEELDKAAKSAEDPLNQYRKQRVDQLKDDLQDLRIDMDFDDDDYKKSLEQAKIWRDRSLRNQWVLSDNEKNAIQDLYSAKVEQIEQQQAAKLEKIREESAKRTQEMLKSAADIEFEHTHSAFEKQLRDIEQWKEAQLEKAETAEEVAATIKNAAMKEADAFEKEMDRIKGKIESAQDRLARLTLSQYENDVRNAQKQYLEDIKELPKGLADELYRAEMRQIKKRAGEDTSGDYTKRPSGGGQDFGGGQFLDFTQKSGQSAKSWLDVDSSVLAQQKLLGTNSRNWQDVNAKIENATRQTIDFNDSVKKAADGSEKFAEKFDKITEEIGKSDADKNLQNKFDSLGDQATQTADKFKNASSTIQQAAKIFLGWEKQKSEEKIKFPDEEQKSGGTIYGDDPFYSHNYEQNGIKVIYGDDESGTTDSLNQNDSDVDEFLSQFNSPAQKIESTLQPLQESFQGATEEVENATKKFHENFQETADATTPLIEKLSGLSTSIETISTAIQNAAEKISQFEVQLQTPTSPQFDLSKDFSGNLYDPLPKFPMNEFFKNPLEGFTSAQNYSADNLTSNNANFDLTSAIQQISDSQSQRTIEIITTINELTQTVTTSLAELSQSAGQIAQSLSNTQTQKQPPTINIQLTPNINLAGAYVFDNTMKRQLTDEIASEVANAVKSAVESSASQMNYGYGN